METLDVMLMDDEYMAIEYMRNLLPWEKYGYRIVSEVTESGKVIAAFKKEKPQIVISDIRMPGVDGIELCREMLAIDSSVRIILLTAYSEFEYAKRAIGMGVSGYLLKHEMDENSILRELDKLREGILHQRDTRKMIDKLVIMNSIGGCDGGVGRQKWSTLENNGRTFVLLVLGKDHPYPVYGNLKAAAKAAKATAPEPAAQGLWEGLGGGYSYVDEFLLRNGNIAVLYSHKEYLDTDLFRHTFLPVAAEALRRISEKTGCSYSAAVSMSRQEIEQISVMYQRSEAVFVRTPFRGPARVVFAEDTPAPVSEERAKEEAASCLQGIRSDLNGFRIEQACEGTARLFDRAATLSGSPDVLRACCDGMARIIEEWRQGDMRPEVWKNTAESCITVKDIREHFLFVIRSRAASFDSDPRRYSRKVFEAICYMNGHYAENIAVSTVADALEISKSNLSRSFRSETGKSVLDYLTDVRIAIARHLLRNTNYKIYQISEMVGYKTSQYFSQVFLKTTGIHPLEYKDMPEPR